MAITIKSYAKSVLNSFNSSLNRLSSRLVASLSNIDDEHDLKKKEIEKDAAKKKNMADASAKIALANVRAGMLDKGLSRSGDSVQAELDNNLMKANTMSAIDSDAEKAKRENERDRTGAKASAVISYMDDVSALEKERNKAYADQLNKDRDFEAERDDEIYSRFADNRDYEAERSDEIYNRFADNRDYEAERSDEIYDRFADNRDYKAERSDEIYDRLLKEEEKEEEGEASEAKDEEVDSIDEKVTPAYNAKTLVDKIFTTNRAKYSNQTKMYESVRNSINAILDDDTIDASYRYQVKLYAKALGYI